jgi:hypothetical protein
MHLHTSGSHRAFMALSSTLLIVLGFILVIGWRHHFRTLESRRMVTELDVAMRKQRTLPINSVVVAAPGRQQPLKPSMLLADATLARFDATAPLVPERSTIEVLPIINANSVLAEATQVIRKYMDTPNWRDRIIYVHEPQRVGKLMEDYYERQQSIDPVVGALMDQGRYRIDGTEIVLLTYRSARLEGKLEIALRQDQMGHLVIDWESLVGYSEISFKRLIETKATTPKLIRAYVKLDDYYNYEFSDAKKYLSLKLTSSDSEDSLNAYCERDSVIGRWIVEDLGTEPSSSLVKGYTIWVSYPPDAKSNRCLNLVQLAAGRWLIVPKKK